MPLFKFVHVDICSLWLGDMKEAEKALKSSRGAMSSILDLSEIPDAPDPETSKEAAKLRETPLPGEQVYVWAVQAGDDEQSQQGIPTWVSKPIERAITRWLEEAASWKHRIDSRANSFSQRLTKHK